jgi:hypothetical protein
MNIDYSKITDDPRVVKLLKLRIEIEDKIKAIDETALIKHELELLSLPDVVSTSKCCNVDCKDMTEINSVYCEFHGSM